MRKNNKTLKNKRTKNKTLKKPKRRTGGTNTPESDNEINDNIGKYLGEVKIENGKKIRHGKGKNIYTHLDYQDFYEGNWKNNKRDGYGKMIYNGSLTNRAEFEGEWKEDDWGKTGKVTYKNGDVYEGDIRKSLKHGKGIMKYGMKYGFNGGIYEGEWYEDRARGKGKIIYGNGNMYEGDFFNDVPHGNGKYTYKNDDIFESVEGEWEKGINREKGKIIYKNGDIYEGGCFRLKSYGRGKLTYANGDILEGTWKDGIINGIVKITHKNGTIIETQYKNGEIEKEGIIKYTNGDIYIGCINNGKKHGKGKLTFADGKILNGMWDDDNYVSPVSHISTNVKVETLFTIDCSHKNNITLSNKILKELSKEELFTPCLICSDNITILDIVTKNVVGHSERDSKKEIVDKKTKLIHLLHVDCYEDFKKNGDYCNNTGCNCPNEGRINRFIYKRIPEIKNISLPFMEIFLHDSCFINKNSYTETIEKYLEK